MIWNITLTVVSIAGLSVNLGLMVHNYRLMKRWQKLDAMLLELCIDAYRIRLRAPIWELIKIKQPRD
jgi:hypothetical protein